MSLNKTSVAIGVVALVVIVAAVALAMGAGDDGGEDEGRPIQEYHLDLTEHVGGYTFSLNFDPVSPGEVSVYLYDQPLCDGDGVPIVRGYGYDHVRIAYVYEFEEGQDIDYIRNGIDVRFLGFEGVQV